MDTKEHLMLYKQKLVARLDTLNFDAIASIAEELFSLIGTERTLFICGNGGSAALASHMVADLGKTILGKQPRQRQQRMRVIALNDCGPLLTAWSNDEGYKYGFSEPLRSLGRPGDLLLVITGSGNSENILEVLAQARSIGVRTIGFLGFDGGKAKGMLDNYLLIEENDYGVVEDIHAILNHMVVDWLKSRAC